MRAAAALLIALAAAACGDSPPAAPATAAAPTDAPRLVFREDAVSFGMKYDDETADVTVAFRNTGGRTLHVNRIDVDCACARLAETPTELAPGAEAELRLRLKFVGVSGPIRHRVAIDSDDPATPIARAWMTGEIKPRLVVEPAKVELRPARFADTTTAELDVRSGDGGSLRHLQISALGPALSNVTTNSTDTGAHVHIEAAPFEDDFRTSIVLRLGSYERVIPVHGFAARDVRAVPEAVTAGLLRRGEPVDVRLVGRAGLKWRVKSVESDRADLSGEMDGEVLRIRIGDKAPAGPFTGAVFALLEGAKPARVRIPVRAVVRE